MITIPSTEVLFIAAAILLVLMLGQWFLGGMLRRDLRGQKPEKGRPSRAPVSFHRAA